MKVIRGKFSGRSVSTRTGNICICSYKRNQDIYLLAEDIISCREIVGNIKEFTISKSLCRYFFMLWGQSYGGVAGVLSQQSDFNDRVPNMRIAELQLKTGEVLFIKCENTNEFLDLLYFSKQPMTYETDQALKNGISQTTKSNIKKHIGCLLFILLIALLAGFL